MTDNEIVKALECCSTYGGSCEKCPAYVKVDRSNCNKVLVGALDIINRQKAEIEGLIAVQETLQKYIAKAKAEAIKEFAEMLKEWAAGAVLCIDERDVDNLVKEMVGDDNA